MINVKNVNKYYNKGKLNEIHVLNDVNLTLPDIGFVTFLGASGSGKTTLLNVLGGLDKASGSLSYDENEFKNYKMNKIDEYRREHIGYIFQNYQLLTELTIYENLKLALEAIGINDPKECKARINYCLKKVGLYAFRNKPAGALSGGQMQRVSIARALIKDCKIIIADEPTGNLDSQNSLEIMNILKQISKKSLVLLVTHNASLAEFYSDTIIEIKDGKIISERESVQEAHINEEKMNKIYLGELNKSSSSEGPLKYDLYTTSDEPLDIQIVEHNGQYFIRSSKKIKLLNESPFELIEGKYQQTKKEDIQNSDFDYDTSFFNDTKTKYGIKEFFNEVLLSFKNFFKRKRKGGLFLKIVFFIIGIIMAFTNLFYVTGTYIPTNGVFIENAYKFVEDTNEVHYGLSNDDKSLMEDLVRKDLVTGFMKSRNDTFFSTFKPTTFIEKTLTLSGFGLELKEIDSSDLISGRMPSNEREIVVTKKSIDTLIEDSELDLSYDDIYNMEFSESFYGTTSTLRVVGITKNKDTDAYYSINKVIKPVSLGYYNYNFDYNYGNSYDQNGSAGYYEYEDYQIVYGDDVSDGKYLINEYALLNYFKVSEIDYTDPKVIEYINDFENVYFASEYYENNPENKELLSKGFSFAGIFRSNSCAFSYLINNRSFSYHIYEGRLFTCLEDFEYEIIDGKEIQNHFEVLVSNYSGYNVGDRIGQCEVVGIYRRKINLENYNTYLRYDLAISDDLTKECIYFSKEYEVPFIKTNNINEVKEYAESKNYIVLGMKESILNDRRQALKSTNSIMMPIFGVLMILVSIYTYFTMRSSMLKDIYSLGVKRSLGFSRMNIIRKNAMDAFMLTLFTSAIGYILTTAGIYYFQTKLDELGLLSNTPPFFLLPSTWVLLLALFAISFVFGLIPIVSLLIKTPSEITSKYDI